MHAIFSTAVLCRIVWDTNTRVTSTVCKSALHSVFTVLHNPLPRTFNFTSIMYSATEPAFVQELKQKPEYKIIHELLQQPDTDPNAAAEKIIDLTIEGIDNEQSSHYYDTACSVVEIARRTEPEHQDKLCKFVAALRLRPINHPRTGEPLLLSGTRVWTELPAFGYTFGDEIQGISKCSSVIAIPLVAVLTALRNSS